MGEGVVGSNFPWKIRFYISAYASVFRVLMGERVVAMKNIVGVRGRFSGQGTLIYRSSEVS